MKKNPVIQRLLCLAAALALLLSLGSVPGLAAEEEAEIEIVWLNGAGEPEYYINELDWVLCDGYEEGFWYKSDQVFSASTGERIAEFDEVGLSSEGRILVSKQGDDGEYGYGFIDLNGEVVIPLEYDYASAFSEGLACVGKNGKCGYIDKDGNIAIPFAFEMAHPFSNGLALVGTIDSPACFINKQGEVVISFQNADYDLGWFELDGFVVQDYFHGLAAVWEYDFPPSKHGCINTYGEVVIPIKYDEIQFSYPDDIVLVREGTKYGFYNTNGKMIVPPEYDYAVRFSEGLGIVGKWDADGKMMVGFVDTSGKVVIPLVYDYVEPFSDGLAFVNKPSPDGNDLYGYINQSGEFIISLDYGDYGSSDSKSFSDGMAIISKKDAHGNWKYGYIDLHGNIVIQPLYIYAGSFSDGLAYVEWKDTDGCYQSGYIDKNGSLIGLLPQEYRRYQVGNVELFESYGDGYVDSFNGSPGLYWIYTGSGGMTPSVEEDRPASGDDVTKKYGVFKIPHALKTPSDSKESALTVVPNASEVPTPSTEAPNSTSAVTDVKEDSPEGLTIILAFVSVVAVAAVILLLVLLLRKKKSAATVPSPQSAAKAVFCPLCGARADPGAAFCPGCGKELPRR